MKQKWKSTKAQLIERKFSVVYGDFKQAQEKFPLDIKITKVI